MQISTESDVATSKNVSIYKKCDDKDPKFRLSNHGLMIETGHHNGIPEEARFCSFCSTEMENEFHF